MTENYSTTRNGDIKDGGIIKARKEDKIKRRQQASWSFPPKKWHKANFDGAAKGNPGLAGCGEIIRNSLDGGIVVFSSPIGHQTNHLAEASAARLIVKLALDSGIKYLWLEGDSLNIINCILGVTNPSWTIESIIKDLKIGLEKIQKLPCLP